MMHFTQQIAEEGSIVVPGLLSDDFIQRCKSELEGAMAKETEYHGGEDHQNHGMVLLCSLYGGTFIELFENTELMAHFNAILGNGCIVYAYTSSSMAPGTVNYSGRIHVDCPRLIPNYITNMGATILLDDFTEENGATWYMPNSHLREDEPSQEEFDKQAKRVIAKAGSVSVYHGSISQLTIAVVPPGPDRAIISKCHAMHGHAS